MKSRTWRRKGDVPSILQDERAECGLACLAMVAAHFGHEISLANLRLKHPIESRGTTLQDLMNIATSIGLETRPIKCDLAEIADLAAPAVLHWDMSHFVVLASTRRDRFIVHDPAIGVRRLSLEEMSRHFTGVALELAPSESFERKEGEPRMGLLQFVIPQALSSGAIVRIGLLSILLEALMLWSPFYMQIVIDEGIAVGDFGLVAVLAAAFAVLTVGQVITSATRTLVIAQANAVASTQALSGLMNHLLRLPLAYFERRSVSHLLSRLRSASAIHSAIAAGIVSTFLDAVMAVGIVVMMILFSPLLTTVAVTGLALYFAIVAYFAPRIALASIDQVALGARQESELLDILRSSQSIKLGVTQAQRLARWKNRYLAQLENSLWMTSLGVYKGIGAQLVLGVESLLAIAIGATLVMEGRMTVGVLMAFLAYRGQFSGRVIGLVDKVIAVKAMNIHFDRVRDIVEQEPEPPSLVCTAPLRMAPALEARDLSYAFPGSGRLVFRGVNFKAEPGEVIAIFGPSGCGKTTFLKVMLGLLESASGEITLDGRPVTGMRDYILANRMSAVLQGDTLATGSLAENISGLDDAKDLTAIETAAMLAQIDREIRLMPMGYFSLIGELGHSLSAGQYQRVLLARTFYRGHKIVLLDEATSNLDAMTEAAIIANFRAIGATVLWVTHREQSRALASRTVEFSRMEDGSYTICDQNRNSVPDASTGGAFVSPPPTADGWSCSAP